MHVLYIHGFGSRFDATNEKVVALEELGPVFGVDVDYTQGYDACVDQLKTAIDELGIDLVVGTSMGGYMAIQMAFAKPVKFVALNPAIRPGETLKKWIGSFTDYTGTQRHLAEETVAEYPAVAQSNVKGDQGAVFLESNDEVIDAETSVCYLSPYYKITVFEGGNHRFTRIGDVVKLVKETF